MSKVKKEAQQIYDSLDDNAKFGLSFGLFPVKFTGISKDVSVELIRISQKETGVEF